MTEAEAVVLDCTLRWSKRESALEQGWLLADLQQRFGYDLEQLAQRFDRSVSWVASRLALLELLPQSVQQQVRSGEIAAQVATKYLLPVARSSLEDCRRMAAAFTCCKCTTRQAGQLYAAWRQASPQIRQRILAQPQLFLKTQSQAAPPSPASNSIQQVFGDVELIATSLTGSTADLKLRPQNWNEWIKRRANGCITSSIAPCKNLVVWL